MATTTFSGPIKGGTISNTTGTTVGDNVANVGQVVMSQSIMIDAAVAAGTTTYNVGVIPKNSQLLTTTIRVAIASDQGTTATVSVGTIADADAFIATASVKALATTHGTLDTEATNVGTTDIQVLADFTGTNGDGTTGAATVTVMYLQNNSIQDAVDL